MMMRRMAFLAGLICMIGSIPAHAACTGSGLAFFCPAGSTPADIQAAVSSSADGAVVTLAAGTYTLGGGSVIYFSLSHGDTIICATAPLTVGAATVNPCIINATYTPFGISVFPSGTNTHLYRLSGFTINDSTAGNDAFGIGGGCSPCSAGVLGQVRVDHNTFALGGNGTVAIAVAGSPGDYAYGVVDHNLMTSPSGDGFFFWTGAVDASPATVSPQGTANNFFVEDNTIAYTNISPSTAGEGVSDSWGNAAIVWRHNTVTNGLFTAHAVDHGGGPSNIEIYGNRFIANSGASSDFASCYRCIHHQGSNEMIVFNNTFTAYTGKSGDAIDLGSYRDYAYGSNGPATAGYSIDSIMLPCDGTNSSDGNRSPKATWYGYPCWHQPGRDTSGNYHPVYAWGNSWSDNLAQVSLTLNDFGGTYPPNCTSQPAGTCDYFTTHVVANRDVYNAVSASTQSSASAPFNGTTGMGFGTLANRPATCTTSTETAYGKGAAGVGYFATDVGDQGTLYTCSATNTWTVYYTPYTYPHPLVAGGNTQSQAPTAPDGLQATVN